MLVNQSIFVWLIILSQTLFRPCADCHSGWFVDNGISQTILEEQLPTVSVQHLQDTILDLLGLPNQPLRERFPSTIRNSVPKFLLRIYKQLSEKEDIMDESNPDEDGMYLKPRRAKRSTDDIDGIPDETSRIIEESDFIMTFLNNRNALSFHGYDNGTRLSFDLSEVSPNSTQSLMSELHIYKRRVPGNYLNSNLCTITIYAITVVDGIKALRPIHISNSTVDYEGWLRINFTSTLNDWLIKSWSNNLLFITVDYENDDGQWEASSVDTNYLLSFWDDEHQPFVTAYFKNENILRQHLPDTITVSLMNTTHKCTPISNLQSNGYLWMAFEIFFQHQRSKRSLPAPKLKSMHHHPVSPHINPLIDKNLHASPARPCQRYGLYVSFKDLQWEWIIAPQGYGAFYCGGECGFPAPHNVPYTNHAIIQTLAHLMQSSDIPKPCCAPTKLSSISVLYIPKETSVHLRKYPKMVAKSCGCQ